MIDSYKPIVDEALNIANAPETPCVIYQRQDDINAEAAKITASQPQLRSNDLVWQEAVSTASNHDCVDVEANDPLYILYTSGTTGWW